LGRGCWRERSRYVVNKERDGERYRRVALCLGIFAAREFAVAGVGEASRSKTPDKIIVLFLAPGPMKALAGLR
jgi:hypothetical protein